MRLVVPSADGLVLAVPFTLLAVGAAVALTATLQEVGYGTAAFGLSLCFAGVLAGFLLGTGVQMVMLDGVRSAQELVDNYVGALRWWALVGGFLLVAIIVLAAVMVRRPGAETLIRVEGDPPPPGTGPEHGDDGEAPAGDGAGPSQNAEGGARTVVGVAEASSGGSEGGRRKWGDASQSDDDSGEAVPGGSEDQAGDEDGPTGIVPRVVAAASSQGAFDKGESRRDGDEAPGSEGAVPAVPLPGQSPEDTTSP